MQPLPRLQAQTRKPIAPKQTNNAPEAYTVRRRQPAKTLMPSSHGQKKRKLASIRQ